MSKWDDYGLAEAALSATMSKDPSSKVGACALDRYGRVISKGWNGPPKGIGDSWCIETRERKLQTTIHAELNAVLFADRDKLVGSTIYITHPPCPSCAAVIIQTGIKRVVYREPEPAFRERWGFVGDDMLFLADIEVERIITDCESALLI